MKSKIFLKPSLNSEENSDQKKKDKGPSISAIRPIKKGFSLIAALILGVFTIFKKILKPVLGLILILFATGFVLLWIGMIIGGTAFTPYISYFSPGPNLFGYLGILSGILTAGLPIIGLLFLMLRFFSHYRLKRIWRYRLIAIWGLSLMTMVSLGIHMISQFSSSTEYEKEIVVQNLNGNTLDIVMDKRDQSVDKLIHFPNMELKGNQLLVDNVRLRIKKAQDQQLVLEQRVRSNGRNAIQAMKHAKEVDFEPVIQDNKLIINSYYSLHKGEKFKDQSVELILHVPEGMEVNLSEDVRYHMLSSSFDREFDLPRKYEEYSWIMGKEGLFSDKWISQNKYTQEMDIEGIDQISIEGRIDTDIVRDDQYKLSIIGLEKAVKELEKVKLDNGLYLSSEMPRHAKPIKVLISLPRLELIEMNNSGKIRIEGFDQDNMQILNVHGGNIKTNFRIGKLRIELDGRSMVELEGEGDVLDVSLFGGARIESSKFKTRNLHMRGEYNHKNKVSVTDSLINHLKREISFKIFGSPEIITPNRDEN